MTVKFKIADPEVSQSLGQYCVVLLGPYGHWGERYDELYQWCVTNNSQIEGMTVSIPDESTLALFCLKWS